MRDRLASPPAEPLEALLFLQSLAQAGWAEADLGLLGRKIGRILRSAPADFASQARKHGLTHVRILILSASTASHLADALIGTAIRFKFLLDVTIAEYEEPEPWLERNRRELKEDPPDFVLVASDNRMLKLSSPLGDEAAATQMVEGALARISRIAEVVGAATGRPVILQTLAGDPDAIQFNVDLGLPGSPRFLTDEFNRRLVQRARQDSRLVLDVNALASLVGHSAWSAGRYWYAAKYPFATNMVPLYADNFMRIIAAQMGRSRRVLVLDLD
ncbi:MAG TPA: hypothetical protein VF957_03085, partial [Bradyrhizobium sp.]